MKRVVKRVWNLFRGFWSFNIEAKVNRRDFWITFVIIIIIVFSVGLYISVYHFIHWLNQKTGFINTDLGFFFLFVLIFAFYVLIFWIFLIIFMIRRFKDAGLKKYWIYLTILLELTPFLIAIFCDTSKSEIPSLYLAILWYVLPISSFNLPMFLPLLLCLLPSKTKE